MEYPSTFLSGAGAFLVLCLIPIQPACVIHSRWLTVRVDLVSVLISAPTVIGLPVNYEIVRMYLSIFFWRAHYLAMHTGVLYRTDIFSYAFIYVLPQYLLDFA